MKQVYQAAPQPLGFGHRKNEPAQPKLQVLAFLKDALPESPSGADAIVFPETQSAVGEVPWGILLGKGASAEIDKLAEAGADFVVVPSDAEVFTGHKKIGKVLRVNPAVTDYVLRSTSDLPVDAVLVGTDTDEEKKLTWERLMLCQRFAGLLTKPVLVPVPPNVTAEELKMVWDTGVSGVTVDIKSVSDAAALATIREHVDGLKYPSRRKFERLSPVLPHVHEVVEDEPDDEEED